MLHDVPLQLRAHGLAVHIAVHDADVLRVALGLGGLRVSARSKALLAPGGWRNVRAQWDWPVARIQSTRLLLWPLIVFTNFVDSRSLFKIVTTTANTLWRLLEVPMRRHRLAGPNHISHVAPL